VCPGTWPLLRAVPREVPAHWSTAPPRSRGNPVCKECGIRGLPAENAELAIYGPKIYTAPYVMLLVRADTL
jgi:hypothetical protein